MLRFAAPHSDRNCILLEHIIETLKLHCQFYKTVLQEFYKRKRNHGILLVWRVLSGSVPAKRS